MNRFWFLFLIVVAFPLFGQNATGLTFDDDGYDALLMKAPLTRGWYESMPSSASLKIRFEVKSNGSGMVVPIVVEIPHN